MLGGTSVLLLGVSGQFLLILCHTQNHIQMIHALNGNKYNAYYVSDRYNMELMCLSGVPQPGGTRSTTKPLKGRRIFLHVQGYRGAAKLENDVTLLGGVSIPTGNRFTTWNVTRRMQGLINLMSGESKINILLM